MLYRGFPRHIPFCSLPLTSFASFSGKQTCVLEYFHTKGVNDIVWSKDGLYLASASDDKKAAIWDIEKQLPINALKGHDKYVFSINFSKHSNMLVTGSFDETVRLWDFRSCKMIKNIVAHSDPVTSVSFEPVQGQTVLSASYDGLCRLWDLHTFQCTKTVYDSKLANIPPVTFACFTPNGRFFTASSLDSIVRLWEVDTGNRRREFSGHLNKKFTCAHTIHKQGGAKALVLSGSEDGTVHLWDYKRPQVSHRAFRAFKPETPVIALDSNQDDLLAVGCRQRKVAQKPLTCLVKLFRKSDVNSGSETSCTDKTSEPSHNSKRIRTEEPK